MRDSDPTPPEGYDVGGYDAAVADTEQTKRVWITDDETGNAYWFDLRSDVPLPKQRDILEQNVELERTPNGIEQKLSRSYYDDMLEYMITDWFGADDDSASPLPVFLSEMSMAFADLQEHVPEPFAGVDEDVAEK